MIHQLKSLMDNRKLFPGYFGTKNMLRNITLPLEYYFGGGRSRYLMNINFLVTSKCNLNCSFCDYESELNKRKELSLGEIIDFLNSLHDRNKIFFISGGEPFMREDVLDIVFAVKEKGMFCGICTNGILMNRNKIDSMIEAGIDNVIVSLHETRTSASKKAIDNLEYLCKNKDSTKVFVNYAISNERSRDPLNVMNIAGNVGADAIRFEYLSYLKPDELKKHQGYCKKNFGKEMKVISHIGDYTDFDILSVIDTLKHRKTIPIMFKPHLSIHEIKSWYSLGLSERKCFFVWRALFIAPNGDVYPCQYLYHKMGNITEQNLLDIWNNANYKKFRKKISGGVFPSCVRCCKF